MSLTAAIKRASERRDRFTSTAAIKRASERRDRFTSTAAIKRASERRDRFTRTHNDECPNHTNKTAQIILIHNLLLFGVFFACQGASF